MRVFELHFNPRNKGERAFDSFVYEPESAEESQLGSLCTAGELSRVLPQNAHFLDVLSFSLKDAYYKKAGFEEALKEANSFLEKETKKGNVGWLGNLNFAVISINNSILNFTKVGNIKILLVRDGEILDISQNLELQDTEPYPLKVFSNTASGKLSPEDKIFILTKDIFSALSKKDDLLGQLNGISDEKEFKSFFSRNRAALSETSGICLLITMGQTERNKLLPAVNLPRFSKRTVLIAVLLLTMTIAFLIFKDEKKNETERAEAILKQAQSKITMAESFLIIRKDEKAQELFQEAWDLLSVLEKTEQPLRKEAVSLRQSIEKYLPK